MTIISRTNKKGLLHYTSIFTLLMAVALFSASVKATAEDVVLNPGYISGTITIDGVSVNGAYVQARNGTDDASFWASDENYSLAVNTPVGGASTTYGVSAQMVKTGINTLMHLKTKPVDVSEGQTSTLNFHVNPGFVNGRIIVTGATLSYALLSATLNTNFFWNASDLGDYTWATTRAGSDGYFSFPVQPNNDIKIEVRAFMTDGTEHYINNEYFSVSAGETATHDFTINVENPGSITGSIGVNGQAGHYSTVMGYGPGSRKATSTYGNTYSLNELIPGDWTFYANTWMNDWDDFLKHPYVSYTTPVYVPPGSTVTNDIVSDPAFINGTLSLSGSKTLQDLTYGYIEASSINNTPSWGGFARDLIDVNTGEIDLIVTEGDWNVYKYYFEFKKTYDPDNYLDSRAYFSDFTKRDYTNQLYYDGTPVSVTTGQTVNNYDLSLQTGTVTINYSVIGGGTLSSPYVRGNTTIRDENNLILQGVTTYSYGLPDVTTNGSATVVAFPSLYNFTAYAYVDGSLTSFGDLEIEVLPGTDIVVDIGGPELTVSSPSPELYTSSSSVTVSGTVTDDAEVAGVTINGTSVTITSTGNADDPNEVSFSTTVNLSEGPNKIQVVATDTSGKFASDTRTVYMESNNPPVAVCGNVTVSAGDGCSASADINSGSYDPDGDQITMSQSPAGPYGLGITSVTLTVTDDSGESDTCIATVTVEDTTNPTITAPGNVTVEQATADGTSAADVALGSATASDTCDASPTVTNNAPAVFPSGITTVTWTATDAAGNVGTATQTVTVIDSSDDDNANDNDDDNDDSHFVTICHKPGTPAAHILIISESALSGHLGHGDSIGSCEGGNENLNDNDNNGIHLGNDKDDNHQDEGKGKSEGKEKIDHNKKK